MNINKFTQKSLQAVQDCEKIAMDYGNQEIEQEHLLYALLTQDDGLIPKTDREDGPGHRCGNTACGTGNRRSHKGAGRSSSMLDRI